MKGVTSKFIHWDIVNEIRDKLWRYGYGLADLHDGTVVLHTCNKVRDNGIERNPPTYNIDERIIKWLCVTYGLVPMAAFYDGQICMGFCSHSRLGLKRKDVRSKVYLPTQ